MKKTAIIELLIQEQSDVISDLKKATKVYRKASDIDEDDTLDPEDYSHQTEAKEMQLRLENKLIRENNALELLKKYKSESCNDVQLGALVETDDYYFYVGVATHPVAYKGKKVMGVSEKAPLMAELRNKKVGDKVTIGNKTHTIQSIS